ncbi:MAG: TldD/PmbA family protein [Methanosarcinales archaeon]|nr:TldD/PmbA family protein [Methanosarcinales archaeon]
MRAGAKRISGTSGDLLEAARRLLDLAERSGAEEAEVYGVSWRGIDVDLRKEKVETASQGFTQGLGLRAVVLGAVGFSSTSDFSRLKETAEGAVRAARVRGRDPDWKGLPAAMKIEAVQGTVDRSIMTIDPQDGLELARALLEGCAAVSGVAPASGGVACGYTREILVSSQGLDLWEEGTACQAAMETVARGDDVATGYEFDNSRSLLQDLGRIGRRAAEMARGSLGGGKVETGSYDVLLKPVAFAELLDNTLIPSLCADNVQKGRSALAGRLGERLAGEDVQMVDDGLLSGGMGTSGFDGEGVASRRNVILEDGLLKTFLYDSYYAGKDGVQSTGNALRPGYSGVPRIGVRNLLLRSADSRDLLAETGEGVLVNGVIGAHTANPTSGDFSVEARNSFLVRDGALDRPIKSMMIAGNIFDILKDLQVGEDHRAIGSVVIPTVKARMKVIG